MPRFIRQSIVLVLALLVGVATAFSVQTCPSLLSLFPELAPSLVSMGLDVPTPIQQSSSRRALDRQNLLLVAPTGSGKTLAYLLPALTKAMTDDGTVLLVAPTRELAVQLLRDTVELLPDQEESARLAIRGLEPPRLQDDTVTILIGTPPELYASLQSKGGSSFLSALSAVILDEVDVLLPPSPKQLRTALDLDETTKGGPKTAQDERRQKEQKRKVDAAKRRGVPLDDTTTRILSDTERILGLVANARLENGLPQILAGSATASRSTLTRLNQALRTASQGVALPLPSNVQLCRPYEDDNDVEQPSDRQHTIRAVSVPAEVEHRYMELSKQAASDPDPVFRAVAAAAAALKPTTSLLFLCGEFAKKSAMTAAPPPKKPSDLPGKTAVARRNALRKAKGLFATRNFKDQKDPKGNPESNPSGSGGLSAIKACKLLADLDILAQPLHVALGLEATENDDDDNDDELPPFLVTFEGSARGLHLEGVDAVFVVGRPTSAASYLHLAGRVGRATINENGQLVTRPGTVVSICTKGSAMELDKWTKQIGGLELKELNIGHSLGIHDT